MQYNMKLIRWVVTFGAVYLPTTVFLHAGLMLRALMWSYWLAIDGNASVSSVICFVLKTGVKFQLLLYAFNIKYGFGNAHVFIL